MNTREAAIIGGIIIAMILGGYGVLMGRALSQKPSASPTATQGGYSRLQKEIVPMLATLELNGQLPVTVSPGDLGKDNPFSGGGAAPPNPKK
ncbi:hypothetical protein HY065_02910 [Candidatus Berkelbacteria bacterium]|nr:hypothetical protein [Candidatus Berkelbacteria bacterium]